jgi:hypothetical protein
MSVMEMRELSMEEVLLACGGSVADGIRDIAAGVGILAAGVLAIALAPEVVGGAAILAGIGVFGTGFAGGVVITLGGLEVGGRI